MRALPGREAAERNEVLRPLAERKRGTRFSFEGYQAARMTDDDKAAAAEILSPMDASAARLCACKASNIAALGKPPRIYAAISHASASRGAFRRGAYLI